MDNLCYYNNYIKENLSLEIKKIKYNKGKLYESQKTKYEIGDEVIVNGEIHGRNFYNSECIISEIGYGGNGINYLIHPIVRSKKAIETGDDEWWVSETDIKLKYEAIKIKWYVKGKLID